MNQLTFVPITEEHLEDILQIYNYYVVETTVSYHTEPLSLEEMRAIVIPVNSKYKSFIIYNNEQLTGYVLLARYKPRQAFDVSAEVTIYLKPGCTAQGIGAEALQFIENAAEESDFHSLIATISGDNERSISLFERSGYQKCGHLQQVGFKFGQFLDLVTYQKLLTETNG